MQAFPMDGDKGRARQARSGTLSTMFVSQCSWHGLERFTCWQAERKNTQEHVTTSPAESRAEPCESSRGISSSCRYHAPGKSRLWTTAWTSRVHVLVLQVATWFSAHATSQSRRNVPAQDVKLLPRARWASRARLGTNDVHVHCTLGSYKTASVSL
jgi:hypothetical protein